MGIGQFTDRDDVRNKGVSSQSDETGKYITYTDDGSKTQLDVSAKVTNDPDDNVAIGCPTVSKKLRYRYSGTNITMPASYATIFSYTGSGVLFGVYLKFNDDDVRVRITIDGTDEIYELTNEEVGEFRAIEDENTYYPTGLRVDKDEEVLHIDFKCAVRFSSSVLIEGQRSSGGNKTMQDRLVVLTEET